MKKILHVVTLLLGLSMMVSCGGNNQSKTENKETANTMVEEQQESPNAKVEEESEPADTRPRVYANAFDAFVNIRETPKAKAPILGVLRNGPEGAVLLGTEGEWTKVDCNGIVGYVVSKYVQETPTVAYIGTATIDDIAGVYFGDYGMILWNDGTWERGYNWANEWGYYILQNNEVKLIPTGTANGEMDPNYWEDYDDATAEAKSEVLPIDLAHHKLGGYKRQPFITKTDIEKAKKEYGDDWEINLYGDYPRLMSKEEFKRKGH